MHIAVCGLTSFQRILYQSSLKESSRKEVREHSERRKQFNMAFVCVCSALFLLFSFGFNYICLPLSHLYLYMGNMIMILCTVPVMFSRSVIVCFGAP